MNRRSFIQQGVLASTSLVTAPLMASDTAVVLRPLAISMWEFSWLERRWDGAGYEDWDRALSELTERGYNAIRIDPYPHLLSRNPSEKYQLIPHWDNQLWGSPFYTETTVWPQLREFLQKCSEHRISVALSTWWREDTKQSVGFIKSGSDLGMAWVKTLELIKHAGLLDLILFVDISNEYPIEVWTPYLPQDLKRSDALAQSFMKDASAVIGQHFPDIPICFSLTTEFEGCLEEDVSMQELLELHIWIANCSEFNKEVGYDFQRFGHDDYKRLQLNAERVYRSREQYWLTELKKRIALCARWSQESKLPLVTTECWGPIDYKDMPLLKWDWVKEACAFGTAAAAATGRWLGIATSNFCGPQFPGMWKDMVWHKNLTTLIKSSRIDSVLENSKLGRRIQHVQRRLAV